MCLGGMGVIFSLLWSTAVVQKTDKQLHVFFFKVHLTQQTVCNPKIMMDRNAAWVENHWYTVILSVYLYICPFLLLFNEEL